MRSSASRGRAIPVGAVLLFDVLDLPTPDYRSVKVPQRNAGVERNVVSLRDAVVSVANAPKTVEHRD